MLEGGEEESDILADSYVATVFMPIQHIILQPKKYQSTTMLRTLHTLLLAFLFAHTATAADFTPSAPPGPYRVGFHVRQQYDRARVYQHPRNPVTAQATSGDRARPLQTLVWYPAIGTGGALTYRDYVTTVATEEEFSRMPDQVRRATDALVETRPPRRSSATWPAPCVRCATRPSVLGVSPS